MSEPQKNFPLGSPDPSLTGQNQSTAHDPQSAVVDRSLAEPLLGTRRFSSRGFANANGTRIDPSPRSRTSLKTLRQGSKYISLLFLSTIASCSFGYLAAKEQLPANIAPATAQIANSGSVLTGVNTNFITQVVDKVGPAVVRINASTTVVATNN